MLPARSHSQWCYYHELFRNNSGCSSFIHCTLGLLNRGTQQALYALNTQFLNNISRFFIAAYIRNWLSILLRSPTCCTGEILQTHRRFRCWWPTCSVNLMVLILPKVHAPSFINRNLRYKLHFILTSCFFHCSCAQSFTSQSFVVEGGCVCKTVHLLVAISWPFCKIPEADCWGVLLRWYQFDSMRGESLGQNGGLGSDASLYFIYFSPLRCYRYGTFSNYSCGVTYPSLSLIIQSQGSYF